MNFPTQFSSVSANTDTHVLTSYFPLPGLGILPINAFLIRGQEPVLVDTGFAILREGFIKELSALIDLNDLRWIWLTHTDADHVGNLEPVLREAPNARLITTFLGMGKLGLLQQPVDRAYLLNPGQRLNIGDRELVAMHPPVYDAPETTGFFDTRTRTLFSSDCFGALLQKPEETAGAVPVDVLRSGMMTWATVDAPWISTLDTNQFDAQLKSIQEIKPAMILSSHLPPATEMHNRLCENLRNARTAPVFVGPDQKALMQMMSAA